MTWQIITTVFIGRFASVDKQLILRLLGFPVAAAADLMSGEPSAGGNSRQVGTRMIAAAVAATMLMADATLPSHAAEGRVTAAVAKRATSETNAVACGLNTGSASLASRPAHPLVDAEECALKPMDRFKECDGCPDMVLVPAVQRHLTSAIEHTEPLGRWPCRRGLKSLPGCDLSSGAQRICIQNSTT